MIRGLLLALLLTPAWAAEPPSALQVFVFDGTTGAPVAKAGVEAGGHRGETNRDGTVILTPGVGAHRVALAPPRATGLRHAELEAPVAPGELTEVIATLYPDRPPTVALESRALEDARAERTAEAGAETDAGPRGQVMGAVVAESGGQPVKGARLFVRGRGETTTTDAVGAFTLRLPVGEQVLSVVHPRFSPGAATAQVVEGQAVRVTIQLASAALELDAFTVTAPYIEGGVAELSAERRGTSSVVDVIGAEQMSRSGDGDAAAALRRVTGLTIVGGKYVYVRGMGERYASTLLNSTRLPSPEPERRVVPLDMFPTGILGSVVIQKTWSPDMPGGFGGGVVKLRTRGTAEEPFVQVSVGTGYRPDTTFKSGLTYDGGSTDWLGFDDGTRALPGPVRDIVDDRLISVTKDDLVALGRSFDATYNTHEMVAPPPASVSVAAGMPFELGGVELGALGAVGYSQSWLNRTMTRNTFNVREDDDGAVIVTPEQQFRYTRLERNIKLTGLVELEAKLSPRHTLASTTLLLRNTDDITRFRAGFDADQATDIRVHRLEWVERALFDQVLRGEHRLGGWAGTVDWAYALSLATRDEPDRRSYRYDYSPPDEDTADPGGYRMYDRPEGNQRFFAEMDDAGHDFNLAWRVPLTDARAPDQPDVPTRSLKIGGQFYTRTRRSRSFRFRFLDRLDSQPNDVRIAVRGADPDTTLGAESLENAYYVLRDNTQATDAYSADQRILAGYAMFEGALPFDLRAMAGVRVEAGDTTVTTARPFDASAEPLVSRQDDVDYLPSASLTWAFTEAMQLRAGYAQTVTRPDFHELTPAQKDPVDGDRPVKGNPDLERGLIQHYDLRWEWYPSPRETISVAGFYKAFTDPIEKTINPGADRTVSFRNAKGATNLGLEIEARKALGFLGEAWAPFYVAGNVALVWSDVDLSGDNVVTSKSRPLEGQSPYVINLQLGWEDLDAGHHVTALYNVFGRRVAEVGSGGLPDIYEEPYNQLDLVVGYQLGEGLKLTGSANNLIDQEIRASAGPVIDRAYRAGRSFSLGLNWTR